MHTREQINALIKNLPDDVKEAISSVEEVAIITEIEKKYRLHVDQVGGLSNEILLLTVGVTPPQKFIDNVENRLKIPRETALQIAKEVNEKILRPVRESLMQIHKMKEPPKESEQESTMNEEVSIEEIPEAAQNRETEKNRANLAEEKLLGNFSLPRKSGGTPDPYRESV